MIVSGSEGGQVDFKTGSIYSRRGRLHIISSFRARATLNSLYSCQPSWIMVILHYCTWMKMIISDSFVDLTFAQGCLNLENIG